MAILVCGISDEPPVARLISSLKAIGADFLVVDQRDMAETVQLRWQVSNRMISGMLRVDNRVVDINEVQSIYHRFALPEDINIFRKDPLCLNKARSTMIALLDLFDILPVKIVNRRRAMMSNNSKPYQSLLIRKAGFSIPDTLISNEPTAVRRFCNVYSHVVYKSISSVRSIVRPLDFASDNRLDRVALLPTQFQKRIKGRNVRVHVIGENVIATEIQSAETDYRYPTLNDHITELRPYHLHADLSHSCRKLAKALGLSFCGIDLMIDSDRVCCFEVNPSPAYSFYQDASKQPISDSLAAFLNDTTSKQ